LIHAVIDYSVRATLVVHLFEFEPLVLISHGHAVGVDWLKALDCLLEPWTVLHKRLLDAGPGYTNVRGCIINLMVELLELILCLLLGVAGVGASPDHAAIILCTTAS
jgi:hypothetical protein